MFNKTKKQAGETATQSNTTVKKEVNQFTRGRRTLKELLAPDNIDRSEASCLKVNDSYTRTFAMEGFPSSVQMCWLDKLYNYNGDMDVSVHIEPFDDRRALDELSIQITKQEAQLEMEHKRGSNKDITRLTYEIQKLYEQRIRIEQSLESLFHVEILNTLQCKSKEELDKATTLLHNDLKGSRIKLNNLYFRQDKAFLSCLPLADAKIANWYRNFTSDALADCNPFYNSDISHPNGVFMGINLETNTGMFVDFYNRQLMTNSNIAILGSSGSGKTFLLTLLTMRSALQGIRTIAIDPEGDLAKICKILGGTYIDISHKGTARLNPFDIEEEDVIADDGEVTGEKVVIIKDKVSDIINLLAVMAGGITKEEESLLGTVITDLYQDDFGFTEDPESLYRFENKFDEERGILIHGKVKKTMPTFSDFHNKLEKYVEEEGIDSLKKLVVTLRMYKKGGMHDIFDCQTNIEFDMNNIPILTFGVASLDEGLMRPLAFFVAMTFAWEKFIKKYPGMKKRILADEAWQLFSPHMKGNEYTSAAMEKQARRIRKRNGGLLIASQSFKEFKENPSGQAVLANAATKILLRQSETMLDDAQEVFKLTNGEKIALATAEKGDFLIKMEKESSFGYAKAFDYEKMIIEEAARLIR